MTNLQEAVAGQTYRGDCAVLARLALGGHVQRRPRLVAGVRAARRICRQGIAHTLCRRLLGGFPLRLLCQQPLRLCLLLGFPVDTDGEPSPLKVSSTPFVLKVIFPLGVCTSTCIAVSRDSIEAPTSGRYANMWKSARASQRP